MRNQKAICDSILQKVEALGFKSLSLNTMDDYLRAQRETDRRAQIRIVPHGFVLSRVPENDYMAYDCIVFLGKKPGASQDDRLFDRIGYFKILTHSEDDHSYVFFGECSLAEYCEGKPESVKISNIIGPYAGEALQESITLKLPQRPNGNKSWSLAGFMKKIGLGKNSK